ncbi:hypothetical protein JB92DRAFT_2825960 [Gautieria morchelliformis]|nr:hypothetical protein JB92DRAFT_2825960 [Gautieria morchelliformis]
MKTPKPKGKAGCSGDNYKKPGYHLQERMGLSENNDLYNRIRAKKKWPSLGHYESDWQVLAILKKYLQGADFDPFVVLGYPDEQEDRSSNGSGDEDGGRTQHMAIQNKNKTASVLKDQLNRPLTKHKTSSIQPLKAPNLDLSEGTLLEAKWNKGTQKYTLSDGRVLTLDAYPKSIEHYDKGFCDGVIHSRNHSPGWLDFEPKPQLPQTPLKAQMKSVTVVRVIDSPLSSVVDSPKSKLVPKAAKAIKKTKPMPEVSSIGTRSSKCKSTDDIAMKVPMDSIYLEDGAISILRELSKYEYEEILVLNITKNNGLTLSINHFDAHSSPQNSLNLPMGNLQLYFKLDPEDAYWKWVQYRALIETLAKQMQLTRTCYK